ncbi:MAG: hypothetical protein ACKO0V_03570 [bacterium]
MKVDSKLVRESDSKLVSFTWDLEKSDAENNQSLGQTLAENFKMYRIKGPDRLIALSEGQSYHEISKPDDLYTLIADNLDVTVLKHGKTRSRSLRKGFVACSLKAECFLSCFESVGYVTRQPVVTSNFRFVSPGETPGTEGNDILYLGPEVEFRDDLHFTDLFLEQMNFKTAGDRYKAMAAKLVVMLRNHFLGGKPAIVVTANRSHAGKDTVLDFVKGSTPEVTLTFGTTDWALENNFMEAYRVAPDTGVYNFANIRLVGKQQVASAFLERTLTSSVVDCQSVKLGHLRCPNNFVMLFSINQGRFSEDMINRSLVINLSSGDQKQRVSNIVNPRYEFLPKHINEIDAEFYGMIKRWMDAGCPEGTSVNKSWTFCSRVISGILECNGIQCDLTTEKTANLNPQTEAIAWIGATILRKTGNNNKHRARDLVKTVHSLGLAKTVCNGVVPSNEKQIARDLGALLSNYRDEIFDYSDDEVKLKFRLLKSEKRERVGKDNGVATYTFENLMTDTANSLDENPDGCEKEVNQEQIEVDCLLAV